MWLYIEVLFWFISRVQIYGTKKDLSLVDLLNVGWWVAWYNSIKNEDKPPWMRGKKQHVMVKPPGSVFCLAFFCNSNMNQHMAFREQVSTFLVIFHRETNGVAFWIILGNSRTAMCEQLGDLTKAKDGWLVSPTAVFPNRVSSGILGVSAQTKVWCSFLCGFWAGFRQFRGGSEGSGGVLDCFWRLKGQFRRFRCGFRDKFGRCRCGSGGSVAVVAALWFRRGFRDGVHWLLSPRFLITFAVGDTTWA